MAQILGEKRDLQRLEEDASTLMYRPMLETAFARTYASAVAFLHSWTLLYSMKHESARDEIHRPGDVSVVPSVDEVYEHYVVCKST